MGGENGQGQDAFTALLSLGTLGSAFLRPAALPGFAAINSTLSNARRDQREDARFEADEQRRKQEAEQQAKARQAMAGLLGPLGFTLDPSLDPTQQLQGATFMSNLAKQARDLEQQQRQQKSLGTVTEARGRVTSDLPTEIRSSLEGFTPFGQDATQAHDKLLTELADRDKRLALARSVENVIPPPVMGAPTVNLPPEGVTAEEQADAMRRLVQEMTDPRVQRLQAFIMQTGQLPDAKTVNALFRIPLPSLPGGVEVQQARVKPPFAPSVADFTDAQGNVTTRIARIDPNTGQPIVTTSPRGPIGQSPRPPDRNQAELVASLAARAQGINNEAVLPEHRNLTPQQAANVEARVKAASQEITPALQFRALESEVIGLELEISGGQSPASGLRNRARSDPEARKDLLNKTAELNALRRAIRRFQPPSDRGTPPPKSPPPPTGGGSVNTDRLRELGFTAPRQ